MASALQSVYFRLKVAQITFTAAGLIPIYMNHFLFVSPIYSDFVLLTLYSYLGIGLVSLACLIISEPISERVVLFSSGWAVVLHTLSAIFVFRDVFTQNSAYWVARSLTGISVSANALAFGWEVYYYVRFIRQ